MTFLLALLLLAGASPQPERLADSGRVRLEVLSLLEPQTVVVRPRDSTIALPDGGSLAVGRRLVVTRERGTIVARTDDGWHWRGSRLDLGGADRTLDLDVQGRSRRVRAVRGALTIALASDARTLEIVVDTELEDLVASAVAAEIASSTAPAALEAAAIAVRSYVIAHRGRHAAEGFDVCDNTHCLFSQGLADLQLASSRAALAAANATRGRVLVRDGRVVAGYFTACCGGRTATPAEIWGGDDAGDYDAVPCTSCRTSRFYRWTRWASAGSIEAALEPLAGRVGADAAFDVAAGDGGWVRRVVIRSGGRSTTLGGDAFRMAVERRIGWNSIPSPRFTIERVRDRLRFTGGGFGHGIGLCMAGAIERARLGATCDELLSAYFPRTRTALLENSRYGTVTSLPV